MTHWLLKLNSPHHDRVYDIIGIHKTIKLITVITVITDNYIANCESINKEIWKVKLFKIVKFYINFVYIILNLLLGPYKPFAQ